MPNAIRVHVSPPLPSTIATRTSRLTVRLLEPRAGTLAAKLLGLAPSGIGNKQTAVELNEGGLEGVLGVLIDVFGEVGNL